MKLEGIKVLDLSQFLPGPHFTMMMADHGADVIRIESPSGEPTREIGARQSGESVWFRNTHRGKRSIVLDLKRPDAIQAFMRLAREADVIVEAFRPGVVERLGIGYRHVRAINPKIVYCSIAAFGQSGPYANRPAHDVSIEAESGLLSLNQGSDGESVLPCVPAADMAGSLMAMNGVLMALLRRTTTGEGDYIDISMQDSLVSWLVNVVGPVFAQDRPLVPRDERSFGGNAFYNIYRCSDGRSLTLGGAEIKFAENLLNALHRPDLVALCKLPPGAGQSPVKAFLQDTFASQPLAYWEGFLGPLDVCWAPVKNLHEALQSPQLAAREMRLEFQPVDDPYDRLTVLGIPIKFAAEPGRVNPRSPLLGEHTREVLTGVGYSGAEIAALTKSTTFQPL